VSGDVELSMSVPLDSDGFLRRECPTCEREFKWKHAEDDEQATPAPEGGYYCPYCAVQASAASWWTQAQTEAAQAAAFDQVVKPELDKFGDLVTNSGLLEVEVSTPEPERPPGLKEVDDMRLTSFECHPAEPIRVLEDWERPVHCLICGQSVTPDPIER
jgi:hypothetical protein